MACGLAAFRLFRGVQAAESLRKSDVELADEELQTLDTQLAKARYTFVMEDPAGPPPKRKKGTKAPRQVNPETTLRHAAEKQANVTRLVQDYESKLGIQSRWTEGSEDWQRVELKVINRAHRRALDHLEGLVVSRIFELAKMNMGGTGYKLRKHIAKALQSRSQSIRNAVERYNAAAAALKPPRTPLKAKCVVEYAFLGQFDLLRDSRNSLDGKPWATPLGRLLLDQFFKLLRAEETRQRLDIEIARFVTQMRDEEEFLKQSEIEASVEDPAMGYQIRLYCEERSRFNATHEQRLEKLAKKPGFTGSLTPGKRLPPLPNSSDNPPPSPNRDIHPSSSSGTSLGPSSTSSIQPPPLIDQITPSPPTHRTPPPVQSRNNVAYSLRAADVWSLGVVLINMLYHLYPWTDTRQGVCASFVLFRQDPVNFFLQRFIGMTVPVAEMLSNRVFNVLIDANDDSARISASEFGVWARDLPQLLQPHHIPSQDKSARGYASLFTVRLPSLPAPRMPSADAASINAPPAITTPLVSPPVDIVHERPKILVDVRPSPTEVHVNLREVVRPSFSASSGIQTDKMLNLGDVLHWIMKHEAPWRNIECIPQSLAQEVMDKLQSSLDLISSGDSEDRPRFIKCLRSLSTRYDILPAQLYLATSDLSELHDMLVGGAFSDICRARYLGKSVCLKVLRIHNQGKLRMECVKKAFCQEALIWRQVSHRNILAFYGVNTEIYSGRLCFISPWMEYGNINNFLESHPHHDRWQCVQAGMQYLHGLDPCVIHKDIRGANVLVGQDFRCYLADFGISLVVETQLPGTSTRNMGNIRWLPPEVIDESEFDHTLLKKVDIYSYGCTIIEIYTGKPPYSDLRTDGAVAKRIALKELPPQPPADVLPPYLWHEVVASCVSPSPEARPSACAILDGLHSLDTVRRGKQ